MLDTVRRAGRSAPAFVLPATVAGVALVAYLASTVMRDVYYGVPDSIAVSGITATCLPAAGRASCDVDVVRLNPGRFYLRTTGSASSVSVTIGDAAAIARSHVLLVRAEAPGRLTIDAPAGAANADRFAHDLAETGQRTIVAIPSTAPWNRITFTPVPSTAPVVVSELGFFADARDLLRPTRQPLPSISGVVFYSTVAAAIALAVCAVVVAAAWLAPDVMRAPAPWLLASLCLAICVLDLGTMFSPYWSRDIRSMYGAELVQSRVSGNLTGGLYEGSRLVQGLGQTIEPGTVPWHRMPGYGLWCALAAALGRTTDVVEIAMGVVVLQLLLYSAAVGIFVAMAGRLFAVPVTYLLGVLIVLLPKQLNYTEVDSIIAPIALLVLSAIIAMLSKTPAGEAPAFGAFLLVNGAFAFWFLMRTDVLPGWIVVSAALAGRRWRRLAVTIALMAAIALPWALYKRQYRHEFNLMPTNTGEVLFLSLCEVPGAFPYECTDRGYFAWADRFGGGMPTSQRTSNLAVTEVVRHWVTYPVHFGFMVLAKMRRAVVDESWPGFRTRLSFLYGGYLKKGWFGLLLTLVLVSIAVDHQRRRSLLLGWPLFLNMPIFFVVFESAGRFYTAAGVSLLVAAVPLLFERGLPAQVRRHPWRAVTVVTCIGLFIAGGPVVERWVRANDSVHYWTPLLNPDRSTLRFVSR